MVGFIGQNPNFPRIQNTWSTGLEAGWELDVWGRFRRGIEAADADLDASIEDYDAVLVALLAETASAYVDLRTAQQQLAYARDNVETQKGSLEIAETKFEQGAANELDAKQALANLKNTEQLVPAFEARIRDANLRLCVLLGIAPRDLTPELGDGPIPVAPPDAAVGVPADLLRRRPDVRAAERRVAAQARASASPRPICSRTSRSPEPSASIRNASRSCSRKPPPPASSPRDSIGTS